MHVDASMTETNLKLHYWEKDKFIIGTGLAISKDQQFYRWKWIIIHPSQLFKTENR